MSAGTLPRTKGVISVDAPPAGGRFVTALDSTVGQKYIVAVTGLLLVGFLIAHFAGNALIYKGRDALNTYALALRHLGIWLWVARIGLLLIFVAHITVALRLAMRNQAARPEKYRYKATVRASLASRTMVLTGLVILAFTIYHLVHFTFHWLQPTPSPETGWDVKDPLLGRADVYAMVIAGFSNIWISLSYVIAQLLLGVHLSHGISSTFQTLGWSAPRVWPSLRGLAMFVTTVIVLGNISIPVAVLAGWVR